MTLDVDYDATVYYLYRKHNKDWGKIENSFRVFMKFVETLGGVEEKQLGHIDQGMMTERVLRHRVEYVEWKLKKDREDKKREKEARYEDDRVFGGKAVPSKHNVLVDSLGDQVNSIIEEVKTQLPSLTAQYRDSSDSDSDSDSMPEVFFSGLDWSKIKLPGDPGFDYEDCDFSPTANQGPEPHPVPTHTVSAPTPAHPHPHKAQDLASRLLPPQMLPGPSKVEEKIEKLMQSGYQKDFEAGSMDELKKMMNPYTRPKRPSECKYDDDDFPIDGACSGYSTLDAGQGMLDDDSPIVADFKKAFAASAAAAKSEPAPAQAKVPAARPGRWAIIEHSDSSDDDASPPLPGKGSKGGKGAKGYKGGAAMGHRGGPGP